MGGGEKNSLFVARAITAEKSPWAAWSALFWVVEKHGTKNDPPQHRTVQKEKT